MVMMMVMMIVLAIVMVFEVVMTVMMVILIIMVMVMVMMMVVGGYLGKNACGSGFDYDVYVHRGMCDGDDDGDGYDTEYGDGGGEGIVDGGSDGYGDDDYDGVMVMVMTMMEFDGDTGDGVGDRVYVIVHCAGAGAYICGEETALIESIEVSIVRACLTFTPHP